MREGSEREEEKKSAAAANNGRPFTAVGKTERWDLITDA